MKRLVETQPFDIRPRQRLEEPALARHLARPHPALESDILRAAERLDLVQKRRERKTIPRNDHRPCLNASHAIDAFLRRESFHDLVEIESTRLSNHAVHLDGPGQWLEVSRVLGWIGFADTEFVKVVVACDVLLRSQLVGYRVHAL